MREHKKQNLILLTVILFSVIFFAGPVRAAGSAEDAAEEDIWKTFAELESAAGAVTAEDYAALLPQVEALVRTSKDYQEGSLAYKDGGLCWRSDGILNWYDPQVRAAIKRSAETKSTSPQLRDLYDKTLREWKEDLQARKERESEAALSGEKGQLTVLRGTSSAKDVCVFLPYTGTHDDCFGGLPALGEMVAEYTGGELLIYNGSEATIDNLADALERCAVVLVGSHGSNGTFGLTTDTGITEEDLESGHVKFRGKVYYTDDENNEVYDYSYWMTDGTAITGHMDDSAPDSLVVLHSCMGMKTNRMCVPLREKGVGAVFGFSETVSGTGALAMETVMLRELCFGASLAEAMKTVKSTLGNWDPGYASYTLEEAQNSMVAFPIVVSAQDPYPGEGHVNVIQTVKSNWLMPVKQDAPVRYIFAKDQYTEEKLIANDCKAVEIAFGELPEGMNLHIVNDTLWVFGTPTQKGYTILTLRITRRDDSVITKPVAMMVADYSEMNVKIETFTVTAPAREGSLSSTNDMLYKSEYYHLDLFFEAEKETYSYRVVAGQIPINMDCHIVNAVKGWAYLESAPKLIYSYIDNHYMATPPGNYSVVLDFVDMSGAVYRYNVTVVVQAAGTITMPPVDITLLQNAESRARIPLQGNAYWRDYMVCGFEKTDGSLPQGLQLRNSYDFPFGFYGTPATTGDYTVSYTVVNWSYICYFTFNIHVDPSWSICFDAGGGSGSMDTVYVKQGESYTLPECKFTRPRYKFIGWDKGQPGDEITVNEDMTLTAQWEQRIIEVTYQANGGGGSMTPVTLGVGESLKLPACAFTPPAGKQFYRWHIIGELDGTTQRIFKENDTVKPKTDLVIEAMWEDAPPESCTITFLAGDHGDGTMTAVTVPYNSEYILPDAGFTAEEGYRFLYWNVTGQNKYIFAGETITVKKDITAKAMWQKIVYKTLSFDMGGHGTPVAPQKVEYNTVPSKPEDPTEEGWKFLGWYRTTGNFAAEFDFTKPLQFDAVAYAKWEEILYTIIGSLEGEGNTEYSARENIRGGTTVTVTAMPDEGWEIYYFYVLRNDDYSSLPYEYEDGGNGLGIYRFEMPFSNVSLGVTFVQKSYAVTVGPEIENGTVTADKTSAVYGETVTLTVTPDAEYELVDLILDAGEEKVELSDTYSFTMPAAPVHITATFKRTDEPLYQIVDGENSNLSEGTDSQLKMLVRRSVDNTGCFSRFTGVKIDGITVDPANYKAESGSVVLTFKPAYLKTLSPGVHTVTILFTDGEVKTQLRIVTQSASGNPTVPAPTQSASSDRNSTTPETEDTFRPLLWGTLLVLSLAGILVLLSRRKKE